MIELRDEHAVETMGICPERLQQVWATISREIEQKEIPGAVAAITRRGASVRFVAGLAVDEGRHKVPVDFNTIYDVASLTKVTVTLPLVLLMLDRGLVRLKDPVGRFLPEFASPDKQAVTIGQLLTHSAGLAPFYDLHSHGWDRSKIMSFIYQCPLQSVPGTQVVYSDLGYILLGEIIERVLGQSLDQAAQSHIFDPLGMQDSRYQPTAAQLSRVAATEYDALQQSCLHGIVHDENARAMGGVSGHAGLFSTVDDLVRYANMWLAKGRANGRVIISQRAVAAACTLQTGHLKPARRGLGWMLHGDEMDASGDLWSAGSYGHTGFTGTSLFFDPDLELAAVLLTNRVHYGRKKSVVRLRNCFHNAIAASVID